MTSGEAVGRIFQGTREQYNRVLFFGALLARDSRSDVVIVGGSAIEIYTRSD